MFSLTKIILLLNNFPDMIVFPKNTEENKTIFIKIRYFYFLKIQKFFQCTGHTLYIIDVRISSRAAVHFFYSSSFPGFSIFCFSQKYSYNNIFLVTYVIEVCTDVQQCFLCLTNLHSFSKLDWCPKKQAVMQWNCAKNCRNWFKNRKK